jgi:hypothetical protein
VAQQTLLPDAVRRAADGITADRLGRDLDFLASDDLLGRDTGSPGFDKAADYITQRLERAAITPFGDEGTYRQHYDLVEMRMQTTRAYLEIGARRFTFGDDFIMRSLAGEVSATASVVYVGHGWHAPDRGVDPYAGLDVPYNVVALVEGSDPVLKDEYITVAAHLDGAVGSRAVEGDRIYNSADDNASGSAAMLAIAEQMMRAPRPKRSVIFIWDSGEEQGLWGTRRFVHDPPVPLARSRRTSTST